MCLQDETRSVSQDHKESRALVGSRTVKGARSICSPQFPPLPAKFRRLFASFFFHPPPPRGSAALRLSFTVYREINSGRGRKKRGGAELSRFTPPPPSRLVSFKRARHHIHLHFWTGFSEEEEEEDVRRKIVHFFEMIVASIEREFSVWQRMGARECPVFFFRASETLDIHIFLDWFFGRRGGRRREGCSKGNRSIRQRTSARECSVSRVSLFRANETLNVHFWTGFSENVRREIVHFFEMIVGREFSVRQRTSGRECSISPSFARDGVCCARDKTAEAIQSEPGSCSQLRHPFPFSPGLSRALQLPDRFPASRMIYGHGKGHVRPR